MRMAQVRAAEASITEVYFLKRDISEDGFREVGADELGPRHVFDFREIDRAKTAAAEIRSSERCFSKNRLIEFGTRPALRAGIRCLWGDRRRWCRGGRR